MDWLSNSAAPWLQETILPWLMVALIIVVIIQNICRK